MREGDMRAKQWMAGMAGLGVLALILVRCVNAVLEEIDSKECYYS
jgi:hypothetical protein